MLPRTTKMRSMLSLNYSPSFQRESTPLLTATNWLISNNQSELVSTWIFVKETSLLHTFSLKSSQWTSSNTLTLLIQTQTQSGRLLLTQDSKKWAVKRLKKWWEPSLTQTGLLRLLSSKLKDFKLMPSQLHSLFLHWFPLVQILSTFLVTKPIVVPAGLTAQLRHLMIAFVLQPKVHILNSYLLLILLDAVMAQNASPTIAMVVKLPLHGDGLRLKV